MHSEVSANLNGFGFVQAL